MSESAILEVHPGDEVFHSQNFRQLFTESLTPQQCGFQPGESYVDSLLADIQPGNKIQVRDYTLLIKRKFLKQKGIL